jgi:hypothetical protein
MTKIIKIIESNELKELNYFRSDVLFNNMEKERRKILLDQACSMGNGRDANKASIIFACSDGIKKVEARVISLTSVMVTLKGVSSLPVKSIIGVNMIKN